MTGNATARPVGADPLAEISGLSLGPVQGGPPVLHDARLTVPRGQVLGVVGRSGSGKSSLAYSLLGHVRPGLEVRSGTVRVAGLDPFDRADARRLRGRVVSFLGQDPASALNPALRIGTQIGEAVRLRSPARRAHEVRAQVEELLLSVRLPADRAFRRRLPSQVSGGQAQRVALALALAGTPALLVLDEPTSGLDTVLADRMRGLLAEVLSGGDRAALLVSHDPAWVASVAHEVVRLEGGRITGAGTPDAPVPAPRSSAGFPAGGGPGPGRAPGAGSREAPRTESREAPGAGSGGALSVRGLHAAHGRVSVLHGVSLTVPAGSCTAVVGPSGSGKTTLARCLAGLHRPARGTVEWREDGAEGGHGAPVQLVAQDGAAPSTRGSPCAPRSCGPSGGAIPPPTPPAKPHGCSTWSRWTPTCWPAGRGSCREASANASRWPGPWPRSHVSWCVTRSPPRWTGRRRAGSWPCWARCAGRWE